ncbi:CHAT domain-containing protein [Methylobacterium phyllosphaerae]|uniref:CHAT domain-containing protein n=1 Tax=Methylobacterium phyllosphaerae TaxID=418223 RepID=UPI0009F9E771|nr:CHAT domain-containing protein [Methylobacterium phyllosphaerae]
MNTWQQANPRFDFRCIGAPALIFVILGAQAALACDTPAARRIVASAARGPIVDSWHVEQALDCVGHRMRPVVTAAAAYELSVLYAQRGRGDASSFRRAATWARRSAAYLRSKADRALRTSMTLEALRLDFYAASSATDLRTTAAATEAFVRSCPLPPGRPQPCDGGLKLLGEIARESLAQGQPDSRTQAIGAFRRFLASASGRQSGDDRASALLDLGTLLAQQGESLDAAGVDEAIVALREAGALLAKGTQRHRSALAQVNLGALLADHRPTAAGLDEAERLLRPWADPANAVLDPSVVLAAQRNLGGVLFRKQSGNREADLTEAIDLQQRALASAQSDDPVTRIRSATGLAIVLEASSLHEAERLGEATRLIEDALQIKAPGLRREQSKALSVLVQVKLHQRRIGGDVDPAEIERLLAKARASASPDIRETARMAALAADVARALGTEGTLGGRDAAIRDLSTALARLGADRDPTLWATLQNNLGNLCNDRRRPDLMPCAEEAYQRALSFRTLADVPREHAETLVNLANLRFAQRDWRRAGELYGQLAQISSAGFLPALDRDILLNDAARSDRWFERASFALAQLGRTGEAIAVADAGRVRWLRQRLGLDHPRLGLGAAGLDALPEGALLLMPIVTSAGTVVLAAMRRDRVVETRHLMLPRLDGDAVAAFLKTEWLAPYAAAFPNGSASDGGSLAWNQRILQAQAWIGVSLIGPVLRWLDEEWKRAPGEVILSVQGELALLPLHAAALPTGGSLIERVRVSYVPAISLLEARQPSTASPALITLHDPAQEQGLPYSSAETAFAVRAGGVAPPGPLDEEAFFRAFARADTLHFVGHARFDPDEPQDSTLKLAENRRIRVRDIVTRQLGRAPRLVVLSACETGRLETATMANEYVGLPAAMMSVGAKGVVSSLWPVSDGPTLFLMARMLFEIQAEGQHPAEALRRAQIWLVDRTGAELGRFLRELKPEPGSPVALLAYRLSVYFRTAHPYADPAFWAGFVYVGRW